MGAAASRRAGGWPKCLPILLPSSPKWAGEPVVQDWNPGKFSWLVAGWALPCTEGVSRACAVGSVGERTRQGTRSGCKRKCRWRSRRRSNRCWSQCNYSKTSCRNGPSWLSRASEESVLRKSLASRSSRVGAGRVQVKRQQPSFDGT